MAKRSINDILQFRGDISPFLVHLTRDDDVQDAKDKLIKILDSETLVAGATEVSVIRYGGRTTSFLSKKKRNYFCAICFTETPLDEVHCLLDIKARQIDLKPYGVVFLKEKLKKKGVSPVLYINNEAGDQDEVVQALFSLIGNNAAEAKKIMPLFSVFGMMITPPGSRTVSQAIDFSWEREWRLPAASGPLEFTMRDIFIGLCPDNEIRYFERRYSPLKFIDPQRPVRWYATKLIDARKRLGLKHSVV